MSFSRDHIESGIARFESYKASLLLPEDTIRSAIEYALFVLATGRDCALILGSMENLKDVNDVLDDLLDNHRVSNRHDDKVILDDSLQFRVFGRMQEQEARMLMNDPVIILARDGDPRRKKIKEIFDF